jgi:hypothetical protein
MPALAVLVVGLPGLVALYRLLNAIDNSPAEYLAHAGTINAASGVCAAVVLAIAVLTLALTRPTTAEAAARAHDGLARAAVTALAALAAGAMLWWAPVPFAVTRILTLVILAFAGVRFAAASVRRPGHGQPARSAWLGAAAALAAIALGASVLLLAKLHGLAWAYAID